MKPIFPSPASNRCHRPPRSFIVCSVSPRSSLATWIAWPSFTSAIQLPSRSRNTANPGSFLQLPALKKSCFTTAVRCIPRRFDASVDVTRAPNTATRTQLGVLDRRAQASALQVFGGPHARRHGRAPGCEISGEGSRGWPPQSPRRASPARNARCRRSARPRLGCRA
jgi:hypothetical protein